MTGRGNVEGSAELAVRKGTKVYGKDARSRALDLRASGGRKCWLRQKREMFVWRRDDGEEVRAKKKKSEGERSNRGTGY